jgi:hypothetical protein
MNNAASATMSGRIAQIRLNADDVRRIVTDARFGPWVDAETDSGPPARR